MLDLQAVIEPGKTAAGLSIGDPIFELSHAETHTTHNVDDEHNLLDFGSVRIWSRDGVIEQIGVRASYNGCIRGSEIGVGSTLQQVVDALGPVVEDEYDNLIVIDLPGLAFETETWRGEPGRETVEGNLDAKLTEIFVFNAPTSHQS